MHYILDQTGGGMGLNRCSGNAKNKDKFVSWRFLFKYNICTF